MKYKHNKTGNIYIYLAIAANATNGENDGELMVIYHPDNDENNIFVRNEREFKNKFTLIVGGDCEMKNQPKGFWTDHFNTIALYDPNIIEFEELPEEYKNKPNLYKIERESEIMRARREIYLVYLEEFKMSAKNVGINDFWKHWSSVVEENMIREVNNEQKN